MVWCDVRYRTKRPGRCLAASSVGHRHGRPSDAYDADDEPADRPTDPRRRRRPQDRRRSCAPTSSARAIASSRRPTAGGARRDRSRAPALVVLDLMLPELDGLAVMRAVRRTDRTPVDHPLGARLAADRITGLGAGADDYLPEAVLPRRAGPARPAHPASGPRRPRRRRDARNREPLRQRRPRRRPRAPRGPRSRAGLVAADRRRVPAPRRRSSTADGRVLTRDQLLDAVYGSDEAEVLDRTIDVHIGRLRDKLGDDAERAALRRDRPRRRLPAPRPVERWTPMAAPSDSCDPAESPAGSRWPPLVVAGARDRDPRDRRHGRRRRDASPT